MKTLLTIFLLTATIVRGQSDRASSITADFSLDTMGCRGLREKHVSYTQVNKCDVLLDGICVVGKTKQEIIALLNTPNSIKEGFHGKGKKKIKYEVLGYLIMDCKRTGQGSEIIIMIENNIVTNVGHGIFG